MTDAAEEADRVIAELAATGRPFSGNDLRPRLSPAGYDASSFRLPAAERAGLVRRIGTTVSDSPHAKGRRTALWIGERDAAGVPPERRELRRKALTLLGHGAVQITLAPDASVDASVITETGVHQVTRRAGRWRCGCNRDDPAGCSHALAVSLVFGGAP